MILRCLGLSPAQRSTECVACNNCPDLFELEDGDFVVIGRDVTTPDFVWLAGQGGYGFQTSPAASQLVADLITGAAPSLEAGLVVDLSPRRFTA
jgi:glycine/D-amino acid oxidase-like deaminating enzyme